MYKRKNKGWIKHLDFIILDIICLELSLMIAYFVRNGINNLVNVDIYKNLSIIVILMDLVLILFGETFKNVLKRGGNREFFITLRQSLLMYLLLTMYMFVTKSGIIYSRIIVSLMMIIYMIMSLIVRLIWKSFIIRKLKLNDKNALLVVGERAAVVEILHSLKKNNYNNYDVVGIVLNRKEKNNEIIEEIPVVADYNTIVEYATHNWVDEVLVSMNADDNQAKKIVEVLTTTGITVHVVLENAFSYPGVKHEFNNINNFSVISYSMNFITPGQYFIKRSFDILGGIVGCLITVILMIFIAPAIKMASPGPLFFVQERVGKNGKLFKMYKFRSMYPDAEERKKELLAKNKMTNNLMFKMDFDPRIIGNIIDEKGNQKTGIGEFIRKYSLDEFPQFFNVLKGDMSLVGTRPPTVDEYKAYSAHHKARLGIKPGITGIWQTSGRSNILDFEEVVEMDKKYINEWSFGLDLKILLKTIIVVVKKDGSM